VMTERTDRAPSQGADLNIVGTGTAKKAFPLGLTGSEPPNGSGPEKGVQFFYNCPRKRGGGERAGEEPPWVPRRGGVPSAEKASLSRKLGSEKGKIPSSEGRKGKGTTVSARMLQGHCVEKCFGGKTWLEGGGQSTLEKEREN